MSHYVAHTDLKTQGLPDCYVLGLQVSTTCIGQELSFMVINGYITSSTSLHGQVMQSHSTITIINIRRTKVDLWNYHKKVATTGDKQKGHSKVI